MKTQQVVVGAALALSTLCPGALALPNGDVLKARAECKPYKIQSGDNCSKIADERCNRISLNDLYKFNPGLEAKCSNLKVR